MKNKRIISSAFIAVTSIALVALLAGHFATAPATAGAPNALESSGVTVSPDGRITLNADAQANLDRGHSLLAAGPQNLKCIDSVASLLCTTLRDDEVTPALEVGAAVYHRRVHAGIEEQVVDEGRPIFGSDEVICDTTSALAVCRPVTLSKPVLAPGAHEVATYAPLKVTYENGTPTMTLGRPTIPLSR